MRTIKIFLASSSELKEECIAFGNFIRLLDDIYESRGMRIKLIEWEYFDATDNNKRKQDEYNEHVRNSDMFIALFNRTVGLYAREELEVALEDSKKKGSPKIYVFCKACDKSDIEELKNLKEYLNGKGYFWYNFENLDNLQMQFVLQLMLNESLLPQLNVVDGNVRLGDIEVAKMDHLTFMANNEQYQQLSKRLAELPQQIAIARQRAERYPDDESFRDDLQRLLDEFNWLKETMKQEQNFLLETAVRISKLQGEKITDRMQRAITAFEEGNVHKANTILDEAEKDAKSNLESFRQNHDITEGIRQVVIQSIEELLLKISIAKSNTMIPIEERITQIKGLYQSADQMAVGIGYEKEKYADFLLDYARFLYDYADYNKAKEVYLRQISLTEEIFGVDHPSTATSYNNIAGVYKSQGDYDKALEYYRKALMIREKVLGTAHPDTATTYNDIGLVYDSQGDYYKALEYYRKALVIREKVLGTAHPDTATSYNDIGLVYDSQGDYDKALEYYLMALEIRENALGKDHPDTATSYNNIAGVYKIQGDYDKALEYYRMAQEADEKVLGKDHPSTARDYNNIAGVYYSQGDYDKAQKYLLMALEIDEKVLGKDHPDTGIDYNNIGQVYNRQGDYNRAQEYLLMALEINEKVLGKDHPSTATSYNNIGLVCKSLGNYDKALEYYLMALEIRENALGKDHPDTATSYNNIAGVYKIQGDYDKALEYYRKALMIREKVLGTAHPDTATTYNDIGLVYDSQGDYDKALEYYRKALVIREKVLGTAHPDTATTYNDIGLVYKNRGDYDKAQRYNRKALEIRERTLGKAHPDTATSYNNIGLGYYSQGDYVNALKYYRMALEIHEKVLGKDHASTAIDYNNIGMVYNRLGDYNKALEYLQTALEIDEKVLGKDHPETAIDYNNIGLVYNRQGNYDKALEYNQEALEIKQNAFREGHPSIATSNNNIGLVYYSLGDYDKALENYLMALKIRENALGKDHPDTATSYNNIAGVYKIQGDYDKALEYYRMAQEADEKVLGKDHPSTARDYNNIGLVYYSQGDYDKAQKYLLMALEIDEKVFGTAHPDIAIDYINIAGVYDSQGDYDKAQEYYRMAQDVFEKSLEKEHPKTVAMQQVIDNLQQRIDNLSKSTTSTTQPLTFIIPDKDSNLISIDLNQMWFDGIIEKETIDLFDQVLSNLEYIFTDGSNNKIKDNDFWTAFLGTQNLDDKPDYLKEEYNDIPSDLKSIYAFLAYILMRKDAYDLLCDSNPSNLRGKVDNLDENSDKILFNSLKKLRNNETSYDNSKALRSPGFGKSLKRLLFNRLINKFSVFYPNIQFNDDVFYKICTKLGYEQVLGIEPETFKKWLEGRLYVEYINEVKIKNFLCIDDISIKFNESKEIYFLGENGDGKTLILYAIYLAFAGNRIEESLPEAGIAIALLRDAMNRKTNLSGLDLLKTTYGPDQTTEMRKIYAYGTHRGRVNSIDNAEKYGFMTLFDANQTLVNPSEWIKDFCFREMMSQREKSDNQSPIDISDLVKKRKEALEGLFDKILDKKVCVEFDDQDNYRVKYIENGAKLTFEQLSEGYRTTIIFICDLLYRLFEQRPKDDIIHGEEATGVVLIDEIDEHLHPRWQRSIVSRLRSLFPNIQFIFTTHSPHIIQGAGQDAVIYRLYRNKDGKTCASDPFFRKDLDFMMMNTLTTSPLFSMDDARLDSNNGDADTSDSYLMYRIEQLVTEEIKEIKQHSSEVYMSPQEIDELIKKAKEKFLSLDAK